MVFLEQNTPAIFHYGHTLQQNHNYPCHYKDLPLKHSRYYFYQNQIHTQLQTNMSFIIFQEYSKYLIITDEIIRILY